MPVILEPWALAWKRIHSDKTLLLTAALLAGMIFLGQETILAWCWWLEGSNLLIHEIGHPGFGRFNIEFLTQLGGTLAQVIVPVGFSLGFLIRGNILLSYFCLFWLGESFLGMSPYIADARARALPLFNPVTIVADPETHDWANMLSTLGLLEQDKVLADISAFIGSVIMSLALMAMVLYVKSLRKW